MSLVPGKPLRSYFLTAGQVERKLRWLDALLRAIVAARDEGRANRAIDPDKVIVCSDDTLEVLQFGASDDQHAWGETAYELLSGVSPGGAVQPLDEMCPSLSPPLTKTIMRAIATTAEERFASIAELAAAFAAARATPSSGPPSFSIAKPAPIPSSPPAAPTVDPSGANRRWTWLAVALVSSLVGVAALLLWPRAPAASRAGVAPSATTERAPLEPQPVVAPKPLSRVVGTAPAAAAASASASSAARHASLQFKPVGSDAYPNQVILGPLREQESAIESCLVDEELRPGANFFAYLDYPADGRNARFRFDCRDLSRGACACIGRALAQPLSLGPATNDEPGTLTAHVTITQGL